MKYIATRENVEKYAQYIAERPRSHGLFGDDDTIDLQKAMDELKDYTGNVWTHIISLRRDDAVQYGYDYAGAWKNLIRSHRNEIVEAMHVLGKIFLAEHDTERGMAYMEQAAENGNECAWLFLNRRDSLTEPQLMLAATRLLYHMGRIFQDNSLPQTGAVQHIDRKRRRQL